jgi:ABC-type phosphate transport system permease subunit
MSTLLTPRPTATTSLRVVDPRTRRRKLTSALMKGVLAATMALAAVPLFLILYVVAEQGWAVISVQFLT